MSETNADQREQLRELLIATVELAIVRHDLLNDAGYDDEDEAITRRAIANDAANAVQGIDCCDEEPIPEWTALLTALDSAEKREKELEAALRYVVAMRNVKCEHKHPGPDDICAKCIADRALRSPELAPKSVTTEERK